jgi:hypothetical protein
MTNKNERVAWAIIKEYQRIEYSLRTDQFLADVRTESDFINECLITTQKILKQWINLDRAFRAVTSSQSPIVQSLHRWANEWRDEERASEIPISEAHQAHTNQAEITLRRIRETASLIIALNLLNTRVNSLLEKARVTEELSRDQLEGIRSENDRYLEQVRAIGGMTNELRHIEADL